MSRHGSFHVAERSARNRRIAQLGFLLLAAVGCRDENPTEAEIDSSVMTPTVGGLYGSENNLRVHQPGRLVLLRAGLWPWDPMKWMPATLAGFSLVPAT